MVPKPRFCSCVAASALAISATSALAQQGGSSAGLELIGAGAVQSDIEVETAQATTQGSADTASSEQPATAAAADGNEIVVTGSRLRVEAAQEVPLAVTVANAETLEKLHATDIRALTAIAPNVNIIAHAANQGVPIIFMRGFGAVGTSVDVEPAVAIYVDEVYNSTNLGALSDLFDVERIEVLRGPQSTLFGKNASAGAILVYRTRPRIDRFSGKVAVEYGSFNLAQFQGLVTGPIIQDVFGVKVYAHLRRRDGWAKNIVVPGEKMGGEERATIRGGITFRPSADFNLYLSSE